MLYRCCHIWALQHLRRQLLYKITGSHAWLRAISVLLVLCMDVLQFGAREKGSFWRQFAHSMAE